MTKYNKAAVLIQAHVRGVIARSKTRKILRNIPHVVNIHIDYAENLPCNKDFMSTKPDAYVMVNSFRKVGKLERCFSTTKTRVIPGNTNPVYEQDVKISCVGQGTVIFNVMSQHSFGGDTLIGQVLDIFLLILYFHFILIRKKKFC